MQLYDYQNNKQRHQDVPGNQLGRKLGSRGFSLRKLIRKKVNA
jgi:hypothetical protein